MPASAGFLLWLPCSVEASRENSMHDMHQTAKIRKKTSREGEWEYFVNYSDVDKVPHGRYVRHSCKNT